MERGWIVEWENLGSGPCLLSLWPRRALETCPDSSTCRTEETCPRRLLPPTGGSWAQEAPKLSSPSYCIPPTHKPPAEKLRPVCARKTGEKGREELTCRQGSRVRYVRKWPMLGHGVGGVRIQQTGLEKWMKAGESQECEAPGRLEGHRTK